MKRFSIQVKFFLVIYSFFVLVAGGAYAQFPSSSSTINSANVFPKLPPSELCTKDKIVGTWKLLMVYEAPASAELERYVRNPMQYYIFNDDSIYGEYIGSISDLSIDRITNFVMNEAKALQQFVVDGSGTVYFYKNSIATDSLACFISADNSPPFSIGQMLLMLPKNAASSGRMVKVYQKIPSAKTSDSETNAE